MNDGSDSESNESPPFKTVMPSPQLKVKEKRQHEKSMNDKAVVLKKELFIARKEKFQEFTFFYF